MGRFLPDGAGVCGVADMAGNVWEWAADWYGAGYYSLAPFENPRGPEIGHNRVLGVPRSAPMRGACAALIATLIPLTSAWETLVFGLYGCLLRSTRLRIFD